MSAAGGSKAGGDALSGRRCRPCEGGVPALTPQEAQRSMQQLSSEWQLIESGKALWREFSFRDFYRTMSFVNAVAHIANLEDHHPDLQIGYNYCRVRYSTHAIGGLSENDLICAAKIDQLGLK
ncbi:MAG: 4a-hydroxytetrahydrobiopterin dehydratase [Steroidobacteraceae bacterium]